MLDEEVTACAREDAGGGQCELTGEASCMTEMHDTWSGLASSVMTSSSADLTERLAVAPSLSWQLGLDRQAPADEAGVAAAAASALSASIWDTVSLQPGQGSCRLGCVFCLAAVQPKPTDMAQCSSKFPHGALCPLIRVVTIASAGFLPLDRC